MLQHVLVGLGLLSLPFWWGEPDAWAFQDATPVEVLTGYEDIHFNTIMSADGSTLAWENENSTCIYRFETAQTECFGWPENAGLRSSRYNLAALSPDGRYVAMSENFFMMFRDSDIWTLDTETGEVVDRTDEGYFGGLMSSNQPDNLPLDYLPTWNPATGELYFFRSQEREPILVDTGYTLQLYKMAAEGGEPELVRDLTLAVPGPFAVFRPVAFSDDGTKLAFLVLPQNVDASPGSGVWVLDLANDGTEMVAGVPRLRNALPEWTREGNMPLSVQWIDDDLIVWMENTNFTTGISRTPLYLNTETREAVTLIDYSQFEGPADLFNTLGEDVSVYQSLVAGAVPPGGGSYWVMSSQRTNSGGGMSVFALPLPGQEGEPMLVTQIAQNLTPGQESLPAVSRDGKLLMLQTLFNFTPIEDDSE
jgi:hypothetical protein